MSRKRKGMPVHGGGRGGGGREVSGKRGVWGRRGAHPCRGTRAEAKGWVADGGQAEGAAGLAKATSHAAASRARCDANGCALQGVPPGRAAPGLHSGGGGEPPTCLIGQG